MKKQNTKAYLLLLPSMILAVLFSFLPLIQSIIGSFLNVSQQGKVLGFAGLDNYISLFSDKAFINSIGHTVLFLIIFLPLNTVLILLAAILTRKKRKHIAIAEYIFLIPMAVSLSSISLIFREIFRGRVSIANRILSTDLPWLESPGCAIFVLALLGIFLDFGIDYILLLSSFRKIDRSLIEAASIDGAGSLRALFYIELPEVRPMLSVIIFLAIKDAIMISAPVMILTAGGPFRSTETIMYYYYLEAFRSGNRGTGSSIATLMAILAGLIMTAMAARGRHDRENS